MYDQSPSLKIFRTLKQYGEVDEDFLAHLLGRRPADIQADLESLASKGVLVRSNHLVALSSQ